MKKVLLLLSLTLLIQPSIAQPYIQWQRAYGGNGHELLDDVKPTPDGGYIFTGFTTAANGDVTGPLKGTPDIWVVKTDSTGAIEWNKTLGGSNTDFGKAIVPTPDGGFLLAAHTVSDNGDIAGNKGAVDYWVAKLTATGAISWSRGYGGNHNDVPADIAIAPDGNYLVAGLTSSTTGDVTGLHGNTDVWVIKISQANGDLIWQKCYGGQGQEHPLAIATTTDGGFVITGISGSAGGDVTTTYGNHDIWILKANAAGTIQWDQAIGGSEHDRPNSIIQTLDGGYAVVGATFSNDHDIVGYKDSVDIVVAKLSPTGTKEWVRTIGGTNYDEVFSIAQRPDSSFMLLGSTRSSNGDMTVTPQSDDIWLAELHSTGALISQRILGGSKRDAGQCLRITSDSTYLVAGSTQSADGDVTGAGFHPGFDPVNFDTWLIQFKIPQPIHVQQLTTDNRTIKVYPTYTTGVVNILFDGTHRKKQIVLLNALGQIVKENSTIEGNAATLHFTGLAAGTYFLKVAADGKMNSYQVIYHP